MLKKSKKRKEKRVSNRTWDIVIMVMNRPVHACRGMMGNQDKNYCEWVSKVRFFDDFSRIFQFQTLEFSWSKSKYVF